MAKIHCDFYEVFGPDWVSTNKENTECLLTRIQSTAMFGTEPSLHGFTGTIRIGNVVGGFYAVQHEDSRLYYRNDSKLTVVTDTPFATVFFVFYADVGKLVLQNRKFADTPLRMDRVRRLLLEAINEAFAACGIGRAIGIYPPESEISDERFIDEFRNSQQVLQITVTNIDPERIPEGFVYYNPQKERNDIIRESHKHDYINFKKVNLESTDQGDIRGTHIGNDLILAGRPQVMQYRSDDQTFTLKRQVTRKIEIYVDTSNPNLSQEHFAHILDILARDATLDLATPTRPAPSSRQKSFFDDHDEDEDEEK